jgi:hypothetical protein
LKKGWRPKLLVDWSNNFIAIRQHLRKIAPDVYEYITDGEQAGDLERECKAALKDVEAQPRGFTLAAPIRVPPKR